MAIILVYIGIFGYHFPEDFPYQFPVMILPLNNSPIQVAKS